MAVRSNLNNLNKPFTGMTNKTSKKTKVITDRKKKGKK